MDAAKSLRCTIGWHRWQVVAEDEMLVRVCTDCGRRRFHGPLPGTKKVNVNWGSGYTGGGGFGGDGG